jgi:hypothetical protein
MANINPPYRLDPLQTITDLSGKHDQGDAVSVDYLLVTFGSTTQAGGGGTIGGTSGVAEFGGGGNTGQSVFDYGSADNAPSDWRPCTLTRESPYTVEELAKIKANEAAHKWEIQQGFNWAADGPIPELNGVYGGGFGGVGWQTFGGASHKAGLPDRDPTSPYFYEMDARAATDYLGDDGKPHSPDPMDFTLDGPYLGGDGLGYGNTGRASSSGISPWKAIEPPDKFYIFYCYPNAALDQFVVNLRQMGQTLVDYSAILQGKTALGAFGTGGAPPSAQLQAGGKPTKADLYDQWGELPPTQSWGLGFFQPGPFATTDHGYAKGGYLLDRSQEGVRFKDENGKYDWKMPTLPGDTSGKPRLSSTLGPKTPSNGNGFVGRCARIEFFKADREGAHGSASGNGRKKKLIIVQSSNAPAKLKNAYKVAQQTFYFETDLLFKNNLQQLNGAALAPAFRCVYPNFGPGDQQFFPKEWAGVCSFYGTNGGLGHIIRF